MRWERLDRVPNWVVRKMKRKRSNHVNGEHYTYKREGNTYFRKLKGYHRRIPTLRFPRIRVNKFFKSLILAIITFVLAYYFNNSLVLFLEAIAWAYFSFVLFKKTFRWANRISLANDLSFFGLRILGAMACAVSVWLGIYILLSTLLIKNSLYLIIPFIMLLAGLFFLGAFIAFRTNRRQNVVGIWRA